MLRPSSFVSSSRRADLTLDLNLSSSRKVVATCSGGEPASADGELGDEEMTDAPEVKSRAHQLVEAARQLFVAGVMSHSGHANLSVRLDADRFLLTPGFVRDLEPHHLATVSLDGQVLEGE